MIAGTWIATVKRAIHVVVVTTHVTWSVPDARASCFSAACLQRYRQCGYCRTETTIEGFG